MTKTLRGEEDAGMNLFLSQILISKIAVISPAARSKGLMGLKDNQKTKLGAAFTVCLFFLKAGGREGAFWIGKYNNNTTSRSH